MKSYKTQNLLISLLRQKYITKEEYKKAYSLLAKETDNQFYHIDMAKLLVTEEKFSEAKEHLLAIKNENSNPSVYYNLFKIYVEEQDLEKAYK